MARPRRRSLRAVAFASFVTLLGASGASAQQETNTIGPPQLRDFQLPGQRTTPPAEPAPTTTATPAPATTPARTAPKPAAADAKPRAAATKPPRSTAPAATDVPRAAPAPAPVAVRPSPAPAVAAPPTQAAAPPVEAPSAPPAAAPAPTPAAEPTRSSGFSWWWLLLPLLAAAGALLFLRRRGRDEEALDLGGALLDRSSGPQPLPVAEPAPEPEPEPEPAAAPVLGPVEAPRAWLELDIVPERAAATENETIVNYELVLRNAGAAVAGNIRIEAQMFNAGADGEIAEFFAAPLHAHSGSPHVTIPPGEELRLGSAIGMSNDEVRTIEVQGRAIFVPMIAATVAYDWEGGTGRSSKSWLVGREAETPAAKMGAFRLDLGPRIYRQVGRREGKLEMV